MIVLFTDYGRSAPYSALLRTAIVKEAPDIPVIDLLANAPAFNIAASAHLLAAFVPQFPRGTVFVAVVDPGVGGERKPVVLQADGRCFVGPHNGLFDVILRRCKQAALHEIAVDDFRLSASFHGRDLFAPVAAKIASQREWPNAGKLAAMPLDAGAADTRYEVIYIDDFGNAYTGIPANDMRQDSRLQVAGQSLTFERTFSAVQKGRLFCYGNSLGLVEIAANQASAAQLLALQVGSGVTICDSTR